MKDLFRYAVHNLQQRSLRSWITTFGVLISVASLITLVLVSNGLRDAIHEQFEKIGSNRIFLSSAGGAPGMRTGLIEDDIEVADRIGSFDYITPYLIEPAAQITYGREEQFAMVTGYPAKDASQRFADYDLTFAEGRAFDDREKGAAILGHLAAHELFDRDVRLRNSIRIRDKKFTIIGILAPIGNAEDDRQIFIPLEEARALFNKPEQISFMDLTLKEGEDIERTAERLERAFEREKGEDAVQVMTPTQILNFLDNILGVVQGVLMSIAGISLVVGALGIMNMMFTSVLERTREIGIMKSVGARDADIQILYIMEAGLIGGAGGVLGATLGAGVGYLIGVGAAQAGYPFFHVDPDPIVLAGGVLFAVVVGVVSGYLPARQAARLEVVEALRLA